MSKWPVRARIGWFDCQTQVFFAVEWFGRRKAWALRWIPARSKWPQWMRR